MADLAPTKPPKKHLSLIRSFALADFITMGNGFSGTGSIFAMMQFLATGQRSALWLAFSLLPISLILDAADGRVARWRRKFSPLGGDLDSLADVISFGVAPAALAFTVGMRANGDVAILLYFVACGISRLARYNVTASSLSDESGKVKYFEGTPIPTSLLLVTVLAVLTWKGRAFDNLPLGLLEFGPFALHPLVILYAASGSAMISKTLRIPKL